MVKKMKKKIFVCEDHTIIIDGLRLLFSQHDEFELVGFTRHGEELMPALQQHQPDLLILDLNLKEWDGFTLLDEIRKVNQTIKVLILTMYQDPDLITKAQELGANAFLPKNITNEELVQALHQVFETRFFIPLSLRQQLNQKQQLRDQFVDRLKLTRREIEIIRSIAQGLSSVQIATQLNVSSHTVETHRKNIFRKLNISNVAELVHFAHENYLI